MRAIFAARLGFLTLVFLAGNRPAYAQTDETLDTWVKIFKEAPANERVAAFSNPGFYVAFLKPVQADLMHAAETSRIDKQTESSSGSNGSTSSVTKGSVPWLFSIAVEHGALTQSVQGNLMTFKGNVANIIKAINTQDYIESFRKGDNSAFVRNVSRASFSVSFNSNSQNAAAPMFNPNTLASASAHIDLYNHRDPRDSKWTAEWTTLAVHALQDLANARGRFTNLVETAHKSEFLQWQQRAQQRLSQLGPDAKDDQIKAVLKQIGEDLSQTFSHFQDIKESAAESLAALSAYALAKKDVISTINKSPVFSVEYTYNNQSALPLPSSSTQKFAVNAKPPNLSNINLIYTTYLLANSQATLNASTSLFNSSVPGFKIGTVRDYRFSGQLDIPIELQALGTSSLSFSALFLSLLEQPLGQPVTVNSVPISTRGNIGLFQAKWTIGVKNAGLRVPISITASNRTELIKENNVQGTIGISFDIDSLFSKP